MPKQSLVVVESAAKAKTIEKFLGRNYAVRACLGHVRDLPTSRLGVDVEHEFRPQYVVPKERKDVVKRLKDEAREFVRVRVPNPLQVRGVARPAQLVGDVRDRRVVSRSAGRARPAVSVRDALQGLEAGLQILAQEVAHTRARLGLQQIWPANWPWRTPPPLRR